jgi:hypothetical protein
VGGFTGTLETAGKGTFHWRMSKISFWRIQWIFSDSEDNALVILRPGGTGKSSSIFKTEATAEVNLKAAKPAILSLLVILGFYLIIVRNEN